MAPMLHLMRHGQGYHSSEVNENGSQIHDPHLTEKGKKQCAEKCASFDRHDKVELLLASPLRRALETCMLTFKPGVDRGMKITALSMAEEASTDPCDTGSEVEVLKKEFPGIINFDSVGQGWFLHEGDFATDPVHLKARAAKLRRFIRDRPEKEVALVSHGFFNHYLTGDVNDKGEQTTGWWGETEMRTFEFTDESENAMMTETAESVAKRGAEK